MAASIWATVVALPVKCSVTAVLTSVTDGAVAFVPPAAPLIVPAMAGAPKVVAKAPGPVVNPPGEPAYDQTIAEPKASIAAKLEAAMANGLLFVLADGGTRMK